MSSKLKEILDGHINELRAITVGLNVEEASIFSKREKICEVCPLKDGNRCNTGKAISKDLEVVDFTANLEMVIDSNSPQGYHYLTPDGKKVYRGCGCRLSAKQKSPDSSCPAGFWGGEFNKK